MSADAESPSWMPFVTATLLLEAGAPNSTAEERAWLQDALKHETAEAAAHLAALFSLNAGAAETSEAFARKWVQDALRRETGSADALLAGRRFRDTGGTETPEASARKWRIRAAAMGHVGSICLLALRRVNGHIQGVSDEDVVRWLEGAVARGNREAAALVQAAGAAAPGCEGAAMLKQMIALVRGTGETGTPSEEQSKTL